MERRGNVFLALSLLVVASLLIGASLRMFAKIQMMEMEHVLLKEQLRVASFNQTQGKQSNRARKADELPGENNESPLMVLHVGPRKTGSSAIQKFAQAHEVELEQNNFYYLGHYGRSYETNLHFLSDFCLQCKSGGDCDCDRRWKVFEKTVEEHYGDGHDLLISDETFNRFFLDNQDAILWDRLVPILQGWRLRIVFTYRHYHSWIPSSYHQSFHPRGSCDRNARESWPDHGGRTIPSFPEYLDHFSTKRSKQPDWAKSKWETQFPGKMQVFNMHDKGDMIANFFCQMVPEAKAICRRLKQSGSNFTMNSSANKDVLHFDMLATTAYQRGYVNKTLSRRDVAAAAEIYGKEIGMKSLSDFPQECLDKKQSNKLLKLSLQTQSRMIESFPNVENDLRSDFTKETNKGVFCSINANATFLDTRWKHFFETLR